VAGALHRLQRPRAAPPRLHHRRLAGRADRLLRHRGRLQRLHRSDEPAHQQGQEPATASATSTTTDSGYSCTAASTGTLNNQHGSEAGYHG
jgi:hypothetical protein